MPLIPFAPFGEGRTGLLLGESGMALRSLARKGLYAILAAMLGDTRPWSLRMFMSCALAGDGGGGVRGPVRGGGVVSLALEGSGLTVALLFTLETLCRLGDDADPLGPPGVDRGIVRTCLKGDVGFGGGGGGFANTALFAFEGRAGLLATAIGAAAVDFPPASIDSNACRPENSLLPSGFS